MLDMFLLLTFILNFSLYSLPVITWLTLRKSKSEQLFWSAQHIQNPIKESDKLTKLLITRSYETISVGCCLPQFSLSLQCKVLSIQKPHLSESPVFLRSKCHCSKPAGCRKMIRARSCIMCLVSSGGNVRILSDRLDCGNGCFVQCCRKTMLTLWGCMKSFHGLFSVLLYFIVIENAWLFYNFSLKRLT